MVLYAFLGLAFMAGTAVSATIRVDADATGANNGTSWPDAYTNLQTALAAAGFNDEIWIARGTYKPGTSRSSTFQMKNGVSLLGGFTNGMTSAAERNWNIFPSVLSGEIGTTSIVDNVLHVMSGNGASSFVVDGLTITGGYAWDSGNDTDPSRDGGGLVIWNNEAFPTIRNCRFVNNQANFQGGAICFQYAADGATGPLISNCWFEGNSTFRSGNNSGGAVHIFHRKPIAILDSSFVSNSAYVGAGFYASYADPTILRCEFRLNRASMSGGAIWHNRQDLTSIRDSHVEDCVFQGNVAYAYGSAMYWDRAYNPGDVISNCMFYSNLSTDYGGTIYFWRYDGLLTDCIFSGNAISSSGGAIWMGYSDPRIRNSIMTGHQGYMRGGALYSDSTSHPRLENLLIAGNRTQYDGGGLCIYDLGGTTGSIVNCTIAFNETFQANAAYGGGGIYLRNGKMGVTNCIVYSNKTAGSGSQVFLALAASQLAAGYNDIQNGLAGVWNPNSAPVVDGGGNISAEPDFFPMVAGTWTEPAVYTTNSGVMTLRDTNANWYTDQLAGKLLRPDTNSILMFYIASNTQTSISVLGAPGPVGLTGYAIYDMRPTPVSPCVNTGKDEFAPADDLAGTPRPQGPGFDMGAYEYEYDSAAPDDISNLGVKAEYRRLEMTWTNPTNSDYKAVLVLRREGDSPTGRPVDTNVYTTGGAIGDGTVVYMGTGTNRTPGGRTMWRDADLTTGNDYHYAIFAFDEVPNYSAGTLTNAVPIPDTNAPSSVSDLVVIGQDQQVKLDWVNPSDDDFEGVLILRQEGIVPPINTRMWTNVYEIGEMVGPATVVHVSGYDGQPGAFSSWTDTGLPNGTPYTYTVLAYDLRPNYSGTIGTSAVTIVDGNAPGDAVLPAITTDDGIALLTWTNPPDADFTSVLILRKIGSAPTGVPMTGVTYAAGSTVGDGDVLYFGPGNSGLPGAPSGWTDAPLTNGIHYYYKVFACDEVPNYATGVNVDDTPFPRNVIYVSASASGANNGTSWLNAYTNLQSALAAAVANTHIWIAEGMYKPGNNRTDTFQLKDRVSLTGGFTNGATTSWWRDWTNHPTVLSGEIGTAAVSDNVLHVMSGNGATNLLLDGLTITGGYAWDSGNDTDPSRDGGGLIIWNSEAFPTILNCRFVNNHANYEGGAICCNYNANGNTGPFISNCWFEGNSTFRPGNANYGGAVFVFHRKPVTIMDTTFVSNSAGYGGALRTQYADPSILRCVFKFNTASHSGAAVWHDKMDLTVPRNVTIADCAFFGNSATVYGGAMYWDRAYNAGDKISNCQFYVNQSTDYGGGAIYFWRYNGLLTDSIFSGNKLGNTGSSLGGAIQMGYSFVLIRNSMFVGHSGHFRGGAIYSSGPALPRLENVLIAGNRTRYDGGGFCALSAAGTTGSIVNCTIVYNDTYEPNALYGGGGLYLQNGKMGVTNTIVYSNKSAGAGSQAYLSQAGARLAAGYNVIQGGLGGITNPNSAAIVDGGMNLSAEPVFFPITNSTWTSGRVYSPGLCTTTLFDDNAQWEVDALAGMFVMPNTGTDNTMLYIVANAEKTLTVLGDASSGSASARYRLLDFRLSESSPCLDAGVSSPPAPRDDIIGMPRPRGDGYDIGAYEGAGFDPPPRGTVLTIQ